MKSENLGKAYFYTYFTGLVMNSITDSERSEHMKGSERRKRWCNESLTGYLYIAPAAVILILVLVLPLIYSLVLSFTNYNYISNSGMEFVGLSNYERIFSNPYDMYSINVTLIFVFFAVFFEVFLGLLLALAFNNSLPCKNFLRTLIIFPFMISEVVCGLSFRYLLHADFGLINWFLALFNFKVDSWVGVNMALPTIIMCEVWQNMPFCFMIIFAGLQAIPSDILEAARVDGANSFQQFQYVSLPTITPQILIAMIFRTTFALRTFTIPNIVTNGGPFDRTAVLGINIFRKAFRHFEFGPSNAMAWLLIIISMVIVIFYVFLLDREHTV